MKRFLFYIMLCAAVSSACTNIHLITDTAKRQSVTKDFEAKRAAVSKGGFFDIFDTAMSDRQREAMMFLYAYMPLSDIVDYDGQFHLTNVDYALRAREEMSWGAKIPEREFLHFVLPARVNNENLDGCRPVFYEELKGRVEGLSMYDAILEVNHWCHEKVIYTPSDARTSSPLASVKSAYGRCGEESTFAVAALRSVGIPARQVYTPRWAHTDDNHAWVEAWADGKWHFLGACEPEPVLDLGWFNAPASRGMLMNTKVFGHYDGPEEIMGSNACNTEINVTANYAPVATGNVRVTDASGKAVEGARVEFKLYNYAEFYTIASKTTDKDGKASLSAGLGDILVWASKDGLSGYAKLSFGKQDCVDIVLGKNENPAVIDRLDITPPAENVRTPEVTPEQRAENDRRMQQEDSIRNAYTSTFIIDDGTPEGRLLAASRGNHDVIRRIIAKYGDTARRMLAVVSAKDLRDATYETLADNIEFTPEGKGELYDNYVLNPRVSDEMLSTYKSFFLRAIPQAEADLYRLSPQKLVDWCGQNIALSNELNPQRIYISPEGVWRSGMADEMSRNIFFVAAMRSLGVPARIDAVTGKTQYHKDGVWMEVVFGEPERETALTCTVRARYTPAAGNDDPKYYNHFTLSKIADGSPRLLNYAEEGTTWSSLLKEGTQLDTGRYVMVTGTRLAGGGVLTQMTFFSVEAGKTTTIDMTMRDSGDQVSVIGNFNSENTYMPLRGDAPTSLLSTTGRGYYVVGVLGAGQEPTNHALRDIAAAASEFEKWGRGIVLLFPDQAQAEKFKVEEFEGLPSTVRFGIDMDGKIYKEICDGMKLGCGTLPVFIIADTFNRVVFVSEGYTIGLGEQMLRTIGKL